MTGFLARNRALTGIAGTLLVLLVALTVLNRDKAYPDPDLHPENPDPNGARAVAEVLRDRGVEVTVAHDQAELRRQPLGSDTTVMVTSASYLGDDTAATFHRLTQGADTVVFALPPPRLLEGLALGDPTSGEHGAKCQDPLLSGMTIDVRRSPTYDAAAGVRCFDALVLGLASTYVVGGADLFTNRGILRADNAAVALRLLGQHDRLVWYVPDPADVGAAGAVSVRELLPRWLLPSLLLVGFALVSMVVWRFRRLGPVSLEPLPVVVRNSEAVEARGRLYRRSRDRAHVARALRNGTVDRLTAAGHTAEDLAALLPDYPVTDDASLVRLAADLSALEEEVAP